MVTKRKDDEKTEGLLKTILYMEKVSMGKLNCYYDGNGKTNRNTLYIKAYYVNLAVANLEHAGLSRKVELAGNAANSLLI